MDGGHPRLIDLESLLCQATYTYGCRISEKQPHCYTSVLDENGYAYYEKGTVITVFGVEVYNNAEIDYNDVAIAPHDPR